MGELALVRRLLGEDARADDGLAADERTEEGFLPAPPAALVVASSPGFGSVALEVDAIVILQYSIILLPGLTLSSKRPYLEFRNADFESKNRLAVPPWPHVDAPSSLTHAAGTKRTEAT